MNDCYFAKKDWRSCKDEVSRSRSEMPLSSLSTFDTPIAAIQPSQALSEIH